MAEITLSRDMRVRLAVGAEKTSVEVRALWSEKGSGFEPTQSARSDAPVPTSELEAFVNADGLSILDWLRSRVVAELETLEKPTTPHRVTVDAKPAGRGP